MYPDKTEDKTDAYSFRKATSKDIPVIIELFQKSVLSTNKDFYPANSLKIFIQEKSLKSRWRSKINTHYAIVAEKNNQLVGFAGMSFWGMLDMLLVETSCQREGLGSQLLVVLEKYAMLRNIKLLTAQAGLGALPFFESQGFKVVCLNYLEHHNALVPYYLMTKTFL